MKKLFILLAVLLFSGTLPSHAASIDPPVVPPQTFINYGSTWNYYESTTPEEYNSLLTNWDSVQYENFDWTKLNKTGQAAFGDTLDIDRQIATIWNGKTAIALQRNFTVDDATVKNLLISFRVDNGAIIFVNGQKIADNGSEGTYTYPDNYYATLDSSKFNIGTNTISVLAGDLDESTYFDLRLTSIPAAPAPTPEPSSMILGMLGITGLLGLRRKNTKK